MVNGVIIVGNSSLGTSALKTLTFFSGNKLLTQTFSLRPKKYRKRETESKLSFPGRNHANNYHYYAHLSLDYHSFFS